MSFCLFGVACPKCKGKSTVVYTRRPKGYVKRRRKCIECDHRWNTLETYAKKY